MNDRSQIRRPLSPTKVIVITGIMAVVLALVMALSLLLGTADVSLGQIWDSLFGVSTDKTANLIILRIRLPRVLLAGLVGFALSLGGVAFQALLRNPLADPFILGVSSGSALGAILGIVLGFSFHFGVPLTSFAGALFTITLVMLIGSRQMGMESSTILLTGVIINAFFTAIIMFFISTATSSRLHTMLFWLYGDLSQSHFAQSAIIAPVVLIASILLYGFARDLNLITIGEDSALQLGVDVERAKWICFLLVSLVIGLVVSFSGLIGFVGLIMPHLARMAFGSDHRLLLPVSCLGGAIFLVVCDTLARTVVSPSELPVGVITAFVGAPFFITLLRKRGSQWSRS
jgi:iron complex transport system permease protein